MSLRPRCSSSSLLLSASLALPLTLASCGGSTPSPDPPSTGEVAVVHLDQGPAPSAPEKVTTAEAPAAQENDEAKEGAERPGDEAEAEKESEPKEKQYGIIGLL